MREEHVWFSIVVAILTLTLSLVIGFINLDNKKAELTKSGVHPIDILCLYDSQRNQSICTTRASVLQPQ